MGLYFSNSFFDDSWLLSRHHNEHTSHGLLPDARAHRRSASEDPIKTHFSPGRFPKREPSGSVSMMYWMALPTSPVPPVTRITDMIVECRREWSMEKEMGDGRREKETGFTWPAELL